jgi:hypothetical protein
MSTIDVLVDMIENFQKEIKVLHLIFFSGAKVRVKGGVIKWNFLVCKKARFQAVFNSQRPEAKNILLKILWKTGFCVSVRLK